MLKRGIIVIISCLILVPLHAAHAQTTSDSDPKLIAALEQLIAELTIKLQSILAARVSGGTHTTSTISSAGTTTVDVSTLTKPTLNTTSCNGNTAFFSWSPVPNALSYQLTLQSGSDGTLRTYSFNDPSTWISGLTDPSYTWAVAACGSNGCGTPVPGIPFSCSGQPVVASSSLPVSSLGKTLRPSGSVTSSLGTMMRVGSSTTITFTANASAGDTIGRVYLNQSFNNGGQTNIPESASDKTGTNYVFTPSIPGTYTFYGWTYSTAFSQKWYQIPGASVSITVSGAPAKQSVDVLSIADPMTWLVKSVCIDSRGKVANIDPYNGCPSGYTIRKIQSNDPITYTLTDQGGLTQHNVSQIPSLDGSTLILEAQDTNPFDTTNIVSGNDIWHTIGVKNGWVSILSARNTQQDNVVYYGSNCTIGNGYLLFPTTNFLINGTQTNGVGVSYWEKNGRSYPGVCDQTQSITTDAYAWNNSEVTQWQYKKAYNFGGLLGYPSKTMDTLISYVGDQNHMEAYYFTREYGLTRHEEWGSATQSTNNTQNVCNGQSDMLFDGAWLHRTSCHDWSNVVVNVPSTIPLRPISEINLLKYSHFDDAGGFTDYPDQTQYVWHRVGYSTEGNPPYWNRMNATTIDDTTSPIGSLNGVRYLSLGCNTTCSASNPEEVYEDIPIKQFLSGHTYGYGAHVRTETGVGSIEITIQQVDTLNRVLWQDSFEETVSSSNGFSTNSRSNFGQYRFIRRSVVMPIQSGATSVRYIISPLTAGTRYDILDTWLAPWPTTI